MNHTHLLRAAFVAGLTLWQVTAPAADAPTSPSAEVVQPLIDKDLVGVPDKELLMLTVEFAAASKGAS